jgi:hypothetical protein
MIMNPSSNWEYRQLILPSSRDNVEESLNAMGKDGWEVVAVYPKPDANVFVFKKPTD